MNRKDASKNLQKCRHLIKNSIPIMPFDEMAKILNEKI